MKNKKGTIISIISLAIAFVIALINTIVDAQASGEVSPIEIIFCALLVLGIAMLAWSFRIPKHRYAGAYIVLLGLFLTSCAYINFTNDTLDNVKSALDIVMIVLIIESWAFMSHYLIIGRFQGLAFLFLALLAGAAFSLAVIKLAVDATAGELTLVHCMSFTSLAVSGIAIPLSAYFAISEA